MPEIKLATIFCEADTDTDADRAGEYRERRQVDADRPQRDYDRHGPSKHADHLDQQHLDRRRQVGRRLIRLSARMLYWSSSATIKGVRQADQEQGVRAAVRQHDRNQIQSFHGIELTDDLNATTTIPRSTPPGR